MDPGIGCLPGLADAGKPAPAPLRALRAVKAPADDSEPDEDGTPTRLLFDLRACLPVGGDEAVGQVYASEAGFEELGAMLRQLEQDAPSLSASDRMLGVCRLVLAYVASWLKPTQAVEKGALKQPGMLGYHNLRRVDLGPQQTQPQEGEAPVPAAEPDSQLLWQEQSVLRTVCFADQYLHVSQRVRASMRVHVKPRVAAQGGGSLLVFFDGVPPPPSDPFEERQLAEQHAVAVEAARASGQPIPAVPSAPPAPPMTVELGGASWYPWPKRSHMPEGAPPCTPAPAPIFDLDFDPESGASAPAALKEQYTVTLPALKLSGLHKKAPLAQLVRSAVIKCEATGLEARIRFVPLRPLKETVPNVVIGAISTVDSAPGAAPVRPTPAAAPASVVAGLLPRRRSSLRRSMSGPIQEQPEQELAAQANGHGETTGCEAAPLALYGCLDGKVFTSKQPLPHPPDAVADAVVLYDDAVHGVSSAASVNTRSETRNIAPALKSPALMLNSMLWTAVVDALRTALHERRVGAHPLTRDCLRRVLQREGAQVLVAKVKAPHSRRSMQHACSYILASRSTSHLPVVLEHIALAPLPQLSDQACEDAEAGSQSTGSSARSDKSWEVV